MLLVAVDFSKEYNRQNHNILVEVLSDLGVPGWLLQIVIGFLQNREMEVTYKGEQSSKKQLPGGNSLGMFFFSWFWSMLQDIKTNKEKLASYSALTQTIGNQWKKFTWNLSMIWQLLWALTLKGNLKRNPDKNPARPLQYHDRTQHVLPDANYELQSFLNDRCALMITRWFL